MEQVPWEWDPELARVEDFARVAISQDLQITLVDEVLVAAEAVSKQGWVPVLVVIAFAHNAEQPYHINRASLVFRQNVHNAVQR